MEDCGRNSFEQIFQKNCLKLEKFFVKDVCQDSMHVAEENVKI